MQELKNCPFCGGDAKLEQYRSDGLRIQCKNCAAKREQRWLYKSREWLQAAMVEDWNARQPALPADAEDAVLKAVEKLSDMTPRMPKAITYDQGWRIIDVVQRHLCSAIDARRRIEGDGE